MLLLPIGLHARHKVVFVQFQERLPNKSASDVEDCSCQLSTFHLGLDLLKGILHTDTVCNIRADAYCSSSCLFYFFDK